MYGGSRRDFTATVIATLLLAAACSDSPKPDVAPPAAITDLLLVRATETGATLTWTAPGDDGGEGRAATYDLRYSLGALPAGWDSATVVEGLAPPRPAGQADTARVTGLTPDRTYTFALRSMDDAGNASDLSNVVSAETNDSELPSQVTDLRAVTLEPRAVTLRFTAPGDDGSQGTAVAYELRYGPDPITETSWEAATGFPDAPTPHLAGTTETARVTGLVPESTIHVAVRAKDDAGQEGPVSNDVVVTLPVDTVPPAAIQDLAVTATGVFTATLTWTASGNDGNEGRASGYAVRYAEAAITTTTWETATAVAVSLTPKEPGSREVLTLGDLPGGKTLWFCVRAVDEKANRGAISNAVSGTVRREPRTWVVRVDGTGDAPTVQAGIDSASHGDEVLVYPGSYYEHVDFTGKNIRLRSAEGPEVTILDGSHDPGSVVTFRSGETREATLEGFTITGGTGTILEEVLTHGGGILCLDASPTITGNVIADNTAVGTPVGYGGGILLDTTLGVEPLASPVLTNNIIIRNQAATNGGGVTIGGAVAEVRGNVFKENETTYDGGGIYLITGGTHAGTSRILDNEFWGNVAGDHGGAIEAGQSSPLSSPLLIEGNLFVRNEAHGMDTPRGPDTGGAISMRGWAGTITNNTFVGNIAAGVTDCTGAHILVSTLELLEIHIERNIFSLGVGCGVVCRFWKNTNVTLTGNLFWSNDRLDVDDPLGCFPGWQSNNFFTDPLFCDPVHDDYRVRSDSPAVTGGNAIGAYLTPGCTP
jgi:hypothetical protein